MKPYYRDEEADITIYCGDSLEIIPLLLENSIDTVITDTPYNLYFMGKEWDGSGVAFKVELWAGLHKPLKPGASLFAFGGTRTSHRLACAIEDAGFEIRDSIRYLYDPDTAMADFWDSLNDSQRAMLVELVAPGRELAWVYGCLSEDTEILTSNGWQSYDTIFAGCMVLCYNVSDDTFELMPVDEVIIYDYEDTAYSIKSDTTDQIVSRSHRCIVERDGRKVFRYAETLERQESVPILEGLWTLPETIFGDDKGTGNKQAVLLQRLPQSGSLKNEKGEVLPGTVAEGRDNLRRLWQEDLETQVSFQKNKATRMQLQMQRHNQGRGMEESRPQGPGKLEARERSGTQRKNDGRHKSGVEGRFNVSDTQGELSELQYQVCEMPGQFQVDGSAGWVCNGASPKGSTSNRPDFEKVGGGSSHRPQSREQQPKQSYVIQQQFSTQELRNKGETGTTLATVTPIKYKGKMWCIRVPTGAFVARRNGHIFITGNSGFPKSLAVGKAIDKAAGVEREILATIPRPNSFDDYGEGGGGYKAQAVNITAPATPEAAQWEGWGTALKPAFEPIIYAQKPIESSYAKNALRYGVAGLNIDGGRIGTDEPDMKRIRNTNDNNSIFGMTKPNNGNPAGRWPANLILSDSDAVRAGFPDSVARPVKPENINKSGDGQKKGMFNNGSSVYSAYYDEEKSAARFFYTAKADREAREFGWQYLRQSRNPRKRYQQHAAGRWQKRAKRFMRSHPTVKPNDLMDYLVRLSSTPTGGRILDPFMGSGKTLLAAKRAGRPAVGIDISPEYCEIAIAQLKATKRETGESHIVAIDKAGQTWQQIGLFND